MINVLFISHEWEVILGSTHSLVNLLHSIKTEVHPVVVLPRKGVVSDYLTEFGYTCYIVPFRLNIIAPKLRFLKYIPRKIYDTIINKRAIRLISQIIQKENIQLIHSNTSVLTIGYDVAKKNGIKHIWHLREFQDLDFNFMPFTGWKKLLQMVHDSDAVISITNAVAKHFGVLRNKNCYVIYDAVRSINDISYIAAKEKYLLFLGNVIPQKGAETALNIFIGFRKQHKEYTLLYVGTVSDEYKSHLMDIATKNEVSDFIHFAGYQKNVRKYIEKATALLMCSQNEAQGRVTVEAMFYGCPVLGYRSAGTQELIQDGKNGFLFSDYNEAVLKLNRIAKGNNEMIINNAADYVRNNFSEEFYGQKILSVYKSLL